jgi:hypothetical protein
MKPMKPLFIGLLFGVLVMAPVQSSRACSCTYPTFSQAFTESDAVFSGTVVSIEMIDPSGTGYLLKQVTFAVDGCWKGALGTTVLLATEQSEATCGYPFVINEKYLVYAFIVEYAGGLFTDLCWRTQELQNAVDLEILGRPSCSVAVEEKTWSTLKCLFRSDVPRR